MGRLVINYICKGFFIIMCVVIGAKAYNITNYSEKPVDNTPKVSYTETCVERNIKMMLAYNIEPDPEAIYMLCGSK